MVKSKPRTISLGLYEWDSEKEILNNIKHSVRFEAAIVAFEDPQRVIYLDVSHSHVEERWICLGQGPKGILTVRFTFRGERIRIIGAGYWRKGKKIYERG